MSVAGAAVLIYFSPVFFRRDLFSRKDFSDQKTYFVKIVWSVQYTTLDPFSDPDGHFVIL